MVFVSGLFAQTITIDRSKPFDPVAFFGENYKIVEQDERSLSITRLNLNRVQFADMREPNEAVVPGEKKLERLKKARYIRLDLGMFQALWENKELIPRRWKKKTDGWSMTYIYFDGTVLFDEKQNCRFVVGMVWDYEQKRWYQMHSALANPWENHMLSAVVPVY